MDLCQVYLLEMVSEDIHILRELMYRAKDRVESMHDPLVIEISQYLDLKLNQQGELTKSHR